MPSAATPAWDGNAGIVGYLGPPGIGFVSHEGDGTGMMEYGTSGVLACLDLKPDTSHLRFLFELALFRTLVPVTGGSVKAFGLGDGLP